MPKDIIVVSTSIGAYIGSRPAPRPGGLLMVASDAETDLSTLLIGGREAAIDPEGNARFIMPAEQDQYPFFEVSFEGQLLAPLFSEYDPEGGESATLRLRKGLIKQVNRLVAYFERVSDGGSSEVTFALEVQPDATLAGALVSVYDRETSTVIDSLELFGDGDTGSLTLEEGAYVLFANQLDHPGSGQSTGKGEVAGSEEADIEVIPPALATKQG